MSIMKDIIENNHIRHFGNADEKVCLDCLGNSFFKEKFKKEYKLENTECTYCKKEKECISLNDLLDELGKVINFYYEEDPEQKKDFYVILRDVILPNFFDLDENLELSNDILEKFDGTNLIEKEIIGYDESSRIKLQNWKHFCEYVKQYKRYVFNCRDDSIQGMPNEDEITDILYDILEQFLRFNKELIEEQEIGHKYYRVTKCHNNDINNIANFCSPPSKYAKCNRMSAAGISVFYCADTPQTSCLETISDINVEYVITKWENNKTLQILDLTKLHDICCSYFDIDKAEVYNALEFLKDVNKELTSDFCEEISRNEAPDLYYVPTQVFAEYVRWIYKFGDKRIDGIAYDSAKCEGGKCYVLFYSYEDFNGYFPKNDLICKDKKIFKLKDYTDCLNNII